MPLIRHSRNPIVCETGGPQAIHFSTALLDLTLIQKFVEV